MLPATDGFVAAVTASHTYARELYVCDAKGAILERVPVDPSSAVEVGPNLVRRSGTLVIDNRDGRYTPSSGGLIDFGRAYLLRFVVLAASGPLVCDMPLLYADFDEVDVVGHQVTLPVSDGMRVVSADAEVAAPVLFGDGAPLEEVVRAILVACGAPDDDAHYDLDAAGAHLAGDHGYEVGQRWADNLNTLLADHVLDLWAAPPLVYTLRPVPDPTVATPVATLALGAAVRLEQLQVHRQSLARNHAIVDGIDAYGSPFTVEEFDLNPLSPVAYGTPGVGDLFVHRKSDGITTPEQARAVARSLLLTRGVQRTLKVTVPINPALDRRDVVRVVAPGVDSLAMLDSFTVTVAPGAHQVTVTEARALS